MYKFLFFKTNVFRNDMDILLFNGKNKCIFKVPIVHCQNLNSKLEFDAFVM